MTIFEYHRFLSIYLAAMAESPEKMYVLAAVLMLLAIVAVMLRFYSMHTKKVGLSTWDGYMILPALVRCLCILLSTKPLK